MKKWLSLILSLVMIVTCMPLHSLSIGSTSLVSTDETPISDDGSTNETPVLDNDGTAKDHFTEVIVEEESLREECAKHFRMPDGSYTAVVYNAPVHRKDANGVWQDIDNRMSESTVKNKQAYITANGRTVFSKKINAQDPTVFELSENGYGIRVSFAHPDMKNTTAKLSNHAEKYVPTNADSVETQ